LDEHGHVVVVELAKGRGLVGPEPQLADGMTPRGSSAKWDGHRMGFYFLVGWVGRRCLAPHAPKECGPSRWSPMRTPVRPPPVLVPGFRKRDLLFGRGHPLPPQYKEGDV